MPDCVTPDAAATHTMLHVTNLSKSYGKQAILDSVSFTINEGERVGLVGRNGHGKTTLFRLIVGEEQPDDGNIARPSRYTIGYLSQRIQFHASTVIEEASSAIPPNEDLRDETYKAKAILAGLGFLEDDFSRPPAELSGGFQVRLNLAKVLASNPSLLLLDEPTNYLDILSIRWLTGFLQTWRNGLILITHDRAFMDSVTTHTLGIHRRKIKKVEGTTQKLYDQLLQEEELHEKTRANDEKKRKDAEQFINRFRVQATRASAVQSRIKALAKRQTLTKLGAINNLDFAFPAAPFPGKWMLTAHDLAFGYDTAVHPLIQGLEFSVGKRDRFAVVGKNGKGKTTLLNLLARELSPTGGNVTHHANLRIASFGQTNIDRLDREKTVLDEIIAAHPDATQASARAIAGLMMFEGDDALKKVSVLSGGERSRVLLGKLLVSPANLLLLDEPSNHLDMESVDALLEAVDAFDGAVIIVTHSEMILNAVATRLIVFDNGAVSIFEGTYRDFLERVGWQDEHAIVPQASGNATGSQVKNMNKKDIRRMRAEIIADRSKIVGALQQKITTLEETITRLEATVEGETAALVDASASGASDSIRKLSKSIHDGKKRIDELFTELEALSDECDAASKAFDEKLKEFQE